MSFFRCGLPIVVVATASLVPACGGRVIAEHESSYAWEDAGPDALGGSGGTANTGGFGGMGGFGATGGSGATGGFGGSAGTAGFGGTAGTGGTAGSAGNVQDSGVISTNYDTAMEAETHLSAGTNGFVTVAWIGIGGTPYSTNGYVFSTDSGQTWGQVKSVSSPNGLVASDPVLAVDSHNNFYLTWVGFSDSSANPTNMGIYVSRAAAGTTDFAPPVLVSNAGPTVMMDKPWITITNTDAILVTWMQVAANGMNTLSQVARSEDGTAWSIIETGSSNQGRNLYYPCAPVHGTRVWQTFVEYGWTTKIRLQWSDDDGKTWGAPVDVSKSSEMQAAFDDPTCVAEGDTVWVAYGLSNDPLSGESTNFQALKELRIARSDDGGKTFAYYAAHDPAAGAVYLHPEIALQDDGTVALSYYAGQQDEDPNGSLRLTRLLPGAATVEPSIVVHAPVTYLLARSDQRWLGDYTGITWKQGKLHVAYADNNDGITHIGYARITPAFP